MNEFLNRVVEPELMNGIKQAEAYAAADFSSADSALISWLARKFPEGIGPLLIDLGCGPGNISELAAKQWPKITVKGIDGAEQMIALANKRKKLLPQQIMERIEYKVLNLCDQDQISLFKNALEVEKAVSDVSVISNSLLHHLHDPQHHWNAMKLLATTGNAIIVNDLCRPANNIEYEKLVNTECVHMEPILRQDYCASLKAAFSIEEVKQQLIEADLNYLSIVQRSIKYISVFGRLR